MKKLFVVNMFGEPCSGKSTTAAGLFFEMKSAGINCELIKEYAKDLVWQERHFTFKDQTYLTAKQHHSVFSVDKKVKIAISDCPLLLGMAYNIDSALSYFESMSLDLFNKYYNFNILLKRAKPYSKVGRNQNEKQAAKVRTKIINILNMNQVPYIEELADYEAPKRILLKLCQDKQFRALTGI